jgi:hypothetical protein
MTKRLAALGEPAQSRSALRARAWEDQAGAFATAPCAFQGHPDG